MTAPQHLEEIESTNEFAEAEGSMKDDSPAAMVERPVGDRQGVEMRG